MIWATPITSLLALAASLSLSKAEELDVFNARIKYPNQYIVWRVGDGHHVFWNTAGMPAVTSPAALYLRHDGEIDFNNPVAEDFDYHAGALWITVPNVIPGQYQLVLMGDSGNWSETFQIIAA